MRSPSLKRPSVLPEVGDAGGWEVAGESRHWALTSGLE